MPHILILRSGHTHDTIIDSHGDYDAWFAGAMADLNCRFTVRHVPDEGIGPWSHHDGIIITGTPASVRDEAAWMKPLAEWLGERRDAGPPRLAVCFAAQLAAEALGGRVELNPGGWEIGSIQVNLSAQGKQDPLFTGLPHTLSVASTHQDHVAELPVDVTLLAGNVQTPVQAFAWGRHLRALQFHPEADEDIIRRLIHLRRGVLEADARLQGAADGKAAEAAVSGLLKGLRPSSHGRTILTNWVEFFVRRNGPR